MERKRKGRRRGACLLTFYAHILVLLASYKIYFSPVRSTAGPKRVTGIVIFDEATKNKGKRETHTHTHTYTQGVNQAFPFVLGRKDSFKINNT